MEEKQKFNQILIDSNLAFYDNFFVAVNALSKNTPKCTDFGKLNHKNDQIDAIICGWNLNIDTYFLSFFPNLRVIFFRCTSLHHVDINLLKQKKIKFFNILAYADQSTAEFVVFELLRFFTRTDLRTSLASKQIGVIGFGSVAKIVADICFALGMDVFYTCKTSPKLGSKYNYLPLNEIVKQCPILSFHTPAYTKILPDSWLETIPNGTLFMLTTLGFPFSETATIAYFTNNKNSVLLADKCAISDAKLVQEKAQNLGNIVFLDQYAARADYSVKKAGAKVLENMQYFLQTYV